jgi:hypothetical protein
MLSEMAQSLDQGSEHTTDSCITVEEKELQGGEELPKGRRADLTRSRSIIIAAGNKNRRNSLTFLQFRSSIIKSSSQSSSSSSSY